MHVICRLGAILVKNIASFTMFCKKLATKYIVVSTIFWRSWVNIFWQHWTQISGHRYICELCYLVHSRML